MSVRDKNSMKSAEIFRLNKKYSTTRVVTKQKPDIKNRPEDKSETSLLLPEGKARKSEGGLRTQGYFKHSYEIIRRQWYVKNNIGVNEDNAKPVTGIPAYISINLFEQIAEKLRGHEEILKKCENEINKSHYEKILNKFLLAERKDIKAELFESKPKEKYNKPNNMAIIEADKSFEGNIKLPLITVITVVLNDEKNIEETIQSVLNQSYPNVEYIVIDGGSTDGTLEKIHIYQHLIDYWISEKDNGVYHAMNKGVNLALGEYIGILNSGDSYTPDALFSVFNITYNNNLDFISGAIKVIDKPESWYIYPCRTLNTKNILSTPFPHPACFVSSHLYKQIGFFDENLQISGDHDFMIRCIKQNINVGISTKIFTHYPRIGKAYFTHYSLKFKEKEYIRKKNRIGLNFLIYTLLLFFKNQIGKL